MNYASFWSRCLASLLDDIIVYILAYMAGAVAGSIFGAIGVATTARGFSALGFMVGVVVAWLYGALLESSPKQATLGKQALGIVVTDLNGDRISFGRATGRHFAQMLSALLLLIGYLMAAFTEKKQALHDIIAGTLVVNR
ncbi:RDD family protein [Microcoleus sp. N9_B2]|uniref:RDD family protein n=1 Tax=unclassified Microcoleus TaxID=2642155 RepID=UPI002FD313FF